MIKARRTNSAVRRFLSTSSEVRAAESPRAKISCEDVKPTIKARTAKPVFLANSRSPSWAARDFSRSSRTTPYPASTQTNSHPQYQYRYIGGFASYTMYPEMELAKTQPRYAAKIGCARRTPFLRMRRSSTNSSRIVAHQTTKIHIRRPASMAGCILAHLSGEKTVLFSPIKLLQRSLRERIHW